MPTPRSLRMGSFSASFCWLGCSTERDMVVVAAAAVVGPALPASRPVTGPRLPQLPRPGLLPSRPRPPPQGSASMALAPQSRAGGQSEPRRTPRRPFPRSSPRTDSHLPSVRRPSVPTPGALRPSPRRRAAFPGSSTRCGGGGGVSGGWERGRFPAAPDGRSVTWSAAPAPPPGRTGNCALGAGGSAGSPGLAAAAAPDAAPAPHPTRPGLARHCPGSLSPTCWGDAFLSATRPPPPQVSRSCLSTGAQQKPRAGAGAGRLFFGEFRPRVGCGSVRFPSHCLTDAPAERSRGALRGGLRLCLPPLSSLSPPRRGSSGQGRKRGRLEFLRWSESDFCQRDYPSGEDVIRRGPGLREAEINISSSKRRNFPFFFFSFSGLQPKSHAFLATFCFSIFFFSWSNSSKSDPKAALSDQIC